MKAYLETITKFNEWQDYVNRIPMLKIGIEILNTLSKFGDAYIVGGAVRDIVTGNKIPDDIDIATNVPMEKIEELYKSHDIGKNKDFGIVVINHKGFEYEIAQFRSDGNYTDGRRPDSIEIEISFEKDAERRDFTINAMAVDAEGNIIDYFNGMNAIQNKILKTVGDPNKRFKEDYLRMLRAIRFASRLNYQIDDETKNAIKTHASNIEQISSERVMKELLKMANESGSSFANAIIQLNDVDLLKYILPEILGLDELEHSIETHPEGNVYQHVLAALKMNQIKDPIINLAILLHDVGKLTTKTYDDGKVQYLGHARAGVELIEKIADRLKIDNDTKEALIFASENHMKLHDLVNMSNKKIYQLIKNKNWDVLYNVGLADSKARGHLFSQEEWNKVVLKIEEITEKYANFDFEQSIKKIVNGKMVMELKNIKPGPEVGQIINQTIEWVLDNDIDINNIEKIKNYIKDI